MAELEIEEEEKKQEFITIAFKVPKTQAEEFKKLLKKSKRIIKKEGKPAKNWMAVYEALAFFVDNKKKVEEMYKVEEETKKIEEEIKALKDVLPGYLKNKIAVVRGDGFIKVIADKRALGKWYTALKLVLKEVGFKFDWNSYSWVKPVTLTEEEISRLFNFERPKDLPERKFIPRQQERKEKEEMVLGWRIVRGQDGMLWAVKDNEWRPLGMKYFEFNAIKSKIESWENRTRYIY